MQLAHPEVAQPKMVALRPQVCHCSFSERALESKTNSVNSENSLYWLKMCLIYICLVDQKALPKTFIVLGENAFDWSYKIFFYYKPEQYTDLDVHKPVFVIISFFIIILKK